MTMARFISSTLRGGSGHVCKDARQLRDLHKKEVRRCMASTLPGYSGDAKAN